jgi:transcriptional regulator with XRE-family HTH domain
MSADVLHFERVEDAPNRIRELRIQAGMSQQALADRIGTSKMSVSQLERGLRPLTVDYMRAISKAVGAAPADLLAHADNPEPLSLDERDLLDRLRAASPAQRDQMLRVLGAMTAEPEPEKVRRIK